MPTHPQDRSYMEVGFVPAHEDGGSVLKVVPDHLCTRCGVCDPICPTDVIRFDQVGYPVIQTEGCIACGLCVDVCPGVRFDYREHYQKMFGIEDPPRRLAGFHRSAWLCRSPDSEVQRAGSGGGVITQILLGLLAEGEIDAALSVGQDPDNPLWPAPVISRTRDEIIATAGSKYCVVPHAKGLRQVRRSKERFAFVGVGCQVEGLRNLEKFNRSLARRSLLTIGLACHGTLEREATRTLLQHRRVPLPSVRRFHYRGGAFPGKFQAEMDDGSRRDMHNYEYKDAAYNYLFHLYTPQRCLDCPDFSAEFTDLSVADYWVRGEDGHYLHREGSSLVLCRTERGEEILRRLMAAGHLTGSPLEAAEVDRAFKPLWNEKRVSPFVRAARMRARDEIAPDYGLQPERPLTPADRRGERLQALTFIFSHSDFTRRLLVKLLFSPLGDLFTGLNIRRKRWQGKRRALRHAQRTTGGGTRTSG
jgi:coenzyme F420 hydrogenase subunit beta